LGWFTDTALLGLAKGVNGAGVSIITGCAWAGGCVNASADGRNALIDGAWIAIRRAYHRLGAHTDAVEVTEVAVRAGIVVVAGHTGLGDELTGALVAGIELAGVVGILRAVHYGCGVQRASLQARFIRNTEIRARAEVIKLRTVRVIAAATQVALAEALSRRATTFAGAGVGVLTSGPFEGRGGENALTIIAVAEPFRTIVSIVTHHSRFDTLTVDASHLPTERWRRAVCGAVAVGGGGTAVDRVGGGAVTRGGAVLRGGAVPRGGAVLGGGAVPGGGAVLSADAVPGGDAVLCGGAIFGGVYVRSCVFRDDLDITSTTQKE
jgi:hypothetical protein